MVNNIMTSDQISIEVNGKVYVFQLSAYGNEQDQDQTDQEGTVKVNGNELELQGSLWRKVKIDHKITPKTILEFEFQGIKEGEIHSIGFDNDNVVYDKNLLNDQTTDDTTFQIWGSQESSPKWNPITNGIHRYATNLGWHKYKILLEDHFNGRFSYLTFGNDQDVTNPTATAKFRGLKIYEEDNIIPALEIAATSAEDPEGNTDTTPFTFTVTRTGNTTGTNSVYWTVAGSGDNSANAADFANSVFPNSVFPTGTITFEADETTRKFTVDVNGDTDFEKDETFTVTLSNPSNGAIISTASATGTITNDDDNNTIPTLAIAATSAVKPEGNTGSTPFTFTVTRTGNTQEESSVDWLILGNKDDFEDGVLPSGTVTFEVDQTSQEINVNVKGDTVIERNEIFQCWIHNPVNATISTNQANGIIISNDKEVDKPNDDNVNFQEITSLANLKVAPGKSLSVPLFYNTSTNDNTLGGIGLRLHYDSSDIVFKDTTNLLSTNLFGNVTDNSDTENFDADTNTNRYIQFQYLDFAGNWPNQTLPLKLGDFNFTAQSTFANTQLNITSSSLAAGYGLKFDPLLVSKQTWNLDIDGNGKVDALTDGIMAVRYMFGSAFSGNALIAGAIAPNATRSLSEIQTYLQEGTTQKYLDIDGNGKVDALTDGIMAVRYMFGSAFSGNVLIAGAIAPDAIRDLSGIQSYLSGLNTLS